MWVFTWSRVSRTSSEEEMKLKIWNCRLWFLEWRLFLLWDPGSSKTSALWTPELGMEQEADGKSWTPPAFVDSQNHKYLFLEAQAPYLQPKLLFYFHFFTRLLWRIQIFSSSPCHTLQIFLAFYPVRCTQYINVLHVEAASCIWQ